MTDPQDDTQIDDLFRARPDLNQVQLAQPDGSFVDGGAILLGLQRRMAAVIDHFAHGFGLDDYLPRPEVEKLIMGGASLPLVAAAARYGAGLVHSRYGSLDCAWESITEIDIADHVDNLTAAGIAAGTATLDAELTYQGERDPDPFVNVPEEFTSPTDDIATGDLSPGDVVSAYTTIIFGFAVKIGEIERILLNGVTAPRPGEPAAAEWIAQDVYSLIAGRVHQLRSSADDSLSPWIDEFADRDHSATAAAVIDWARQQTSAVMRSTEDVLITEAGPDLQRRKAAARFLTDALEIRFAELLQRVSQAVHGSSFAEECESQNEAIGWTWQLIDTGLVTYLDESRVRLCRAWVDDDARPQSQK